MDVKKLAILIAKGWGEEGGRGVSNTIGVFRRRVEQDDSMPGN